MKKLVARIETGTWPREWLGGKGVAQYIEHPEMTYIRVSHVAPGTDSLVCAEDAKKIRRRIEDRIRKDPEALLRAMVAVGICPRHSLEE